MSHEVLAVCMLFRDTDTRRRDYEIHDRCRGKFVASGHLHIVIM